MMKRWRVELWKDAKRIREVGRPPSIVDGLVCLLISLAFLLVNCRTFTSFQFQPEDIAAVNTKILSIIFVIKFSHLI